MKKITFVALAALTITACSSGPEFEVNGDISGADGKMLYLEASGLEGIVPLDSVKLKRYRSTLHTLISLPPTR